jgi:hypothetical protein
VTSVNLQIQVPSFLSGIIQGTAPLAIVHPQLDCRVAESITARAIAECSKSKVILVITSNVARVVFLLRQWLNVKGSNCFEVAGSFLWVYDEYPENPPFSIPDVIFGIDCHRLSRISHLDRALLAGEMPEKNHWFHSFIENNQTTKIDYRHVLEAYPQECMNEENPYFRKLILLEEDYEPKLSLPFEEFAEKRLYIRTDKPATLLTPRQKKQASEQFGTPVVSFDPSLLQKKYLETKKQTIDSGKRPWFILLKYRRGGFTTLEQAQSYQLCRELPRTDVATLAHTLKSTQRIFRIASLYHELDPESTKLVSESKTVLEFTNGSSFFIGTAGGRGFVRGDTLQRVHGSEVAKWCKGPNQGELIDDLVAGLLGAASYGEVVFESTADGHNWFHQCYEEAKNGSNDFTPIFLRWFDDPINTLLPEQYSEEEIADTLSTQERELVDRYFLTPGQIAFRRQAKKTYGRLFAQEMPEDDVTCFLSSGVCFFDTELLIAYAEKLGAGEHGRRIAHPGGVEIRWHEPVKGREYVAGCDTSEGLPGCDLNGIGIIDKVTGEQVCSLHGLFSPKKLAELAVSICADYNDALLGVERENHGHAVLDNVVRLGYRKPHFRGGPLFYYQRSKDIQNSRPGWTTTSSTRPVMLDALADAIEEDAIIINDRTFISECLTFKKQGSGRFEADPSCHDDSVMKWAIAWQMRSHRKRKPRIALIGSNGA